MVQGRETHLLAANPYTERGRQSLEAGREAVLRFKLTGESAYSIRVPVHLRVTAVLNGRVVKQFLASDPNAPETVPVGGSCAQPPGAELLYSEWDVMRHARSGNPDPIRFYFDEPGRYLVRAELVRDEAAFRHMPAKLKPIG